MSDDPRISIARDAIYDLRLRHAHSEPPSPEQMAIAVLDALDTARPTRSRQAVEAALEVWFHGGVKDDIPRVANEWRDLMRRAIAAADGMNAMPKCVAYQDGCPQRDRCKMQNDCMDRPRTMTSAVKAALERCVQLALEYRDEADNGNHPDASDPAHSMGQAYAANVIALRIRARAAAHGIEEQTLAERERDRAIEKIRNGDFEDISDKDDPEPTPPDAPDENALPADTLWKTIRMVGAREDERRDFLIEMLNCESGGCRSAAASALGEMGEIGALRDRLPVETNKFVIAGITAHLRAAPPSVPDDKIDDENASWDEMGMLFETCRAVNFTYTNWRGETAKRQARVFCVWFGRTEWHPDLQWFLTADDLDKNQRRDFAMKDMSDVTYI